MRAVVRRSALATGRIVGALRTGGPAMMPGIAGALALMVLCLVGIGLPWLPDAIRPLRALADLERRRSGTPIPRPYRPLDGSWPRRARQIVTDPATWRDLAWLGVHGLTSLCAAVLAVGLWPAALYTLTLPLWWWAAPRGSVSAFVPLTNWAQALTLPFVQCAFQLALLILVVPLIARGQLRLAALLLRPTSRTRLEETVERLTETRAEALEAHGAELRRIERDLHDGTQAQLVSVAVRLGLAERGFGTEPDTALRLLREARDGIEDTLANLRGVIRGIYPPILSDRGLAGAVRALAGGHRPPVAVSVPDDLARLPAAVEAAAYFVIAESLTNIAKHSRADHAEVSIVLSGASLRITVRDNGIGGADQDTGSGLPGIRRRVAALDGRTTLASPPGEGTMVEVELPCGS
jgi:signal transduction histidine kinase